MFGGGVARFIADAVGGLGINTGLLGRGGWHSILVRPAPFALRQYVGARTSRETPQGVVNVTWERQGNGPLAGSMELNVSLPAATIAHITLPLLGRELVKFQHFDSEICEMRCGDRSPATGLCVGLSVSCETRADDEPVMQLELGFPGDFVFRW